MYDILIRHIGYFIFRHVLRPFFSIRKCIITRTALDDPMIENKKPTASNARNQMRTLPHELINLVSSHLEEPKNVSSFVQASKQVYTSVQHTWPKSIDRPLSPASAAFVRKLFKALRGMHKFTRNNLQYVNSNHRRLNVNVGAPETQSAFSKLQLWRLLIDIGYKAPTMPPTFKVLFKHSSYKMHSRVTGEPLDVRSMFAHLTPVAQLNALERLLLSNPVLKRIKERDEPSARMQGPKWASLDDALSYIASSPKPALRKTMHALTFGDAKLIKYLNENFMLLVLGLPDPNRAWYMADVAHADDMVPQR